jgi:predicted transcriptional regulator
MDSERRSDVEIMASILDACRYSRRKGHVMCECNVSSRQFTGYVGVLLKANLLLIEIDRGSILYRVSGKGKDFLKAFNGVKTMLE